MNIKIRKGTINKILNQQQHHHKSNRDHQHPPSSVTENQEEITALNEELNQAGLKDTPYQKAKYTFSQAYMKVSQEHTTYWFTKQVKQVNKFKNE